MNRSTRGAAKVSIVWTIVGVVLFVVALVMFFLTNQELSNQTAEVQKVKAELAKLNESKEAEVKAKQELSTVVGFYDESQASSTDVAAVQAGLKNLREAFPDVDENVKSLSKALPIAIQSYTSLKAKVKEQEEQLTSLRSENETAGKTARELAGQKDAEIADLRRQLADTETAKTDQQTILERQVAEAVENFKDRDAKLIAARKALEDDKRKALQKEESLRTRLAEQGRKLNPFVEEPEAADGKVLEVSNDLNLGWINLGSDNRLAMGTRFVVVSGLHGDKRVKGMAEVCDDNNTVDGDGCAKDCLSFEICGNGIKNFGENCDDGDMVDDNACPNNCHAPRCGDGIKTTSQFYTEPCDGSPPTIMKSVFLSRVFWTFTFIPSRRAVSSPSFIAPEKRPIRSA